MAITLIAEAVHAGARQSKACAVLGLTCRTLRRWRAADSLIDRRKGASRKPSHFTSSWRSCITLSSHVPGHGYAVLYFLQACIEGGIGCFCSLYNLLRQTRKQAFIVRRFA